MSIYLGNTEIGQIYLGGTEISEAYLGSTKVFEAGGGSGGGGLSDYVQDGLVFHLDGIERGNTAGHWIDRIGNVDFVLDSGVVEESDCIIGSKSNDICGRNSTFGSNDSTISSYTIECVFKEENNWSAGFQPFIPVSGISLGYATSGTRLVIGTRSSSNSNQWVGWAVSQKVNYNTVSANVSRALHNGAPLSSSGTTYYNPQSAARVGLVNGKTYAVRIYNRKLTASEMLQNQKVDNIRFNLGLTLPETI